MMRVCPKCGDYYADGLLAFCLADGTPLVDVAPGGETWSEGVRVVEEKAHALRQHGRRLKRRRILTSVMTTLVMTVVVCVVVVNSLIYLRPPPEQGVPAEPLTLAATPPPAGLIDSIIPTREPTPTPTATATPTATPTPTPTQVCTDAYKRRESEFIIRSYGGAWRQKIKGERNKIIAEHAPDARGAQRAEASLGEIEFTAEFSDKCRVCVVSARYAWRVRTNAALTASTKDLTVARGKRFTCVRIGGAWLCG